MSLKSTRRAFAAAAVLLMLAAVTGCKPDNVFFRIGNWSGGTLHNVKVMYPGGELTVDTLDNSSEYGTYRHFDGPGTLEISYTTESGSDRSSSGPQVTGNEKGEVRIRIDGSWATFDTQFEPSQQ